MDRKPSNESECCGCDDCSGTKLVSLLLSDGTKVKAFQVQESEEFSRDDEDALNKGQRFFQNNFFSVLVAHMIGLTALFKIESIRKVLKLTGKSETPKVALKRYFNTIIHLKNWYESNIFRHGSKGFQSLEEVRKKHCLSSRLAFTHLSYDITQTDMALTQWAFVGPVLLQPHRLGIDACLSEIEGFLYLWKTVGCFLGLQNRFNICMGSVAEVTRKCRAVLHTFVRPAIEEFSGEDRMVASTILGLSTCIPILHPVAFQGYTLYVLHESQLTTPPQLWLYSANVYST